MHDTGPAVYAWDLYWPVLLYYRLGSSKICEHNSYTWQPYQTLDSSIIEWSSTCISFAYSFKQLILFTHPGHPHFVYSHFAYFRPKSCINCASKLCQSDILSYRFVFVKWYWPTSWVHRPSGNGEQKPVKLVMALNYYVIVVMCI